MAFPPPFHFLSHEKNRLLSGCCCAAHRLRQKEVPPADPVPATTLARTLTFPTASSLSNDTTYAQTAMTSTGQLDGKNLWVGFAPLVGRDVIRFMVPVAALTPAVVGSYKLVDKQRSPGTAASVFYNFLVARNVSTSGSFLIDGESHATRGQLLITAYDAPRRLLSGSFEMAIDGMQNITDKYSVPNDPPLCNLKVTGTFTNLKLQ
ncbi:hypothetical protein [Hymenobacter sp. PAMC 26628]|uniref:hypothetical protein n=1 Tax=Hymenobacter sp. PAMC 26628 TaxID=1484118 RepID=UPI0007704FC8|nr:hypothetical protein [Hymenobacter sp. PAMC 26628]AMJ67257.1 hypothetical protein AXW84_18865 [Hymenobacter sp. PAMC 26628]